MKRKFLTVLLALGATFCLCFGLAACGDDGESGGPEGQQNAGLSFVLSSDESYYILSYGRKSAGDIAIPAQLNGKPVAAIGTNAFYGCDELTSITIPDSVTSIGNEAFNGCSGLVNLTIGDGMRSIGEHAFANCGKLPKIALPDGVTSIGQGAFDGCHIEEAQLAAMAIPYVPQKDLKAVTITSGVIPQLSFSHCSDLTSVTIGSGVTEIEADAFRSCSEIENITVAAENEVYKSEQNCLIERDTNSLVLGGKNSVIPGDVISIGDYAFYGCSEIAIPGSVTSIGDYAFSDCDPLESIAVDESNPNYSSQDGILYNKAKTKFIYVPKAINGSVVIPESMASIEDEFFYNCDELESVTIGSGVKSIGTAAFANCDGLTSVVIPDSVISIGDKAFEYCSGLTDITIGSGVAEVGGVAFQKCSRLTAVYITDLAAWCKIKFTDSGSNPLTLSHHLYIDGEEVTELKIPDGVTEIGAYAFRGCSGLTGVVIPDGVTEIGQDAFANCSGLTAVHITDLAAWCEIDFGSSGANPLNYAHHLYIDGEEVTKLKIPDGVTKIGSYAFPNYSEMTDVEIPDSVTAIGDQTFYYCVGLTSIVIPDGVTSIGSEAFYGCDGLTGVTMGSGVTSIGSEAFFGCSRLESITVDVENPSYSSYDGILYNKTQTQIILAPNAIKGAITIPDGVTEIGKSAFFGCSGLTSIIIPDSVTTIGSKAFNFCSGLTSITIGSGVTSIRDALAYCSGLTDIQFKGTVKEWQDIDRTGSWDQFTGEYTVTCTDGTIKKDGTVTYFRN